MDRHARVLLKQAGKMKGRRVDGAGDILECDALTQLARKVSFGRLGPVSVIGVRAGSAGLARLAVSHERGFKHVGNELKRRHIRPKRFEQFRLGSLKPLHKLAVPPENTRVTRARHEGKRSFRVLVNRGVELADNIVEHAGSPDRIVVNLNPLSISATGLDARFRGHDGFDKFEPTAAKE